MITYETNGYLDGDEIMKVFTSVGWTKKKMKVMKAFKRSYYIMAYDNEQLIGFARALSDDEYYTGIYDVIVKPSHQKKALVKRWLRN